MQPLQLFHSVIKVFFGNDKIQIKIYKIKNKGNKDFDTFIESTLRPITIAEPINSFERSILEAYDRCRAEALRKYFSTLTDKNIKHLLEDNYLRPLDLRKVLKKNRL
jgi:cephalosporin-C deacetylase-like acetyl esterase